MGTGQGHRAGIGQGGSGRDGVGMGQVQGRGMGRVWGWVQVWGEGAGGWDGYGVGYRYGGKGQVDRVGMGLGTVQYPSPHPITPPPRELTNIVKTLPSASFGMWSVKSHMILEG